MNEVNKTLFIPLYGKAFVSKQHIILDDPSAERIWQVEGFELHGKSKSKWLAYNMAMRARVFDDWTDSMLALHQDALVLHIGCGLDGRCQRIHQEYEDWLDCDLGDVIEVRKKYFVETDRYHMAKLDASDPEEIKALPDASSAIVVMEGLSMYLTNEELKDLFKQLAEKYASLHISLDVYTVFGAKASKYKNPINDVGVTQVYGIDDIKDVIEGTGIEVVAEHTFTPDRLVNELKPLERAFFKMLFTGKIYGKIYRLYELRG